MANDSTRSLLELLYHVSREVATALDLRTVLQRVLYAAIDNVGGERGSIVVLDDNGRPVDSTIVYGKQFHSHTTQQLRVTVERGLAGWVVRNRKGALVPDTSKDERWLRRPDDAIQQSGAKAALCVPLMAREKMIGVLTLVHSIPNAFDTGHLELMQAIADQAGIAVLNARLYTESQRQARVMTALAEGAVTINASLQVDDVLQRILTQTIHALQVETVALALLDETSGDLVFRAATGYNAGNVLDRRVSADEGIVGLVASEGRGMVIPVVGEEKRYAEADRFGGIIARAIAVSPIQTQGKVIGVLEAINPISGSFDPDALLVMTGIGSLAGTTIQNAQLFEQLQVAHERYRELFEESIDPILITNFEGKIIEANRMAISMSGYDESTFRQMSIDQIHEVNWGKIGLEFDSLDNEKTTRYESTFREQDEQTIPVLVYVRRVHFSGKESLQWTFHNITERKELDALRDDLTAMIYHDLRSPLANVVSSLDILSNVLSGHDDETVTSLMGIATNSTARMQRLISSLLDINRLESGQPIASQEVVPLTTLIEDSVNAVRPSIDARAQKLETQIPGNLAEIFVDEDMIRRVLINLLENASKFSPTSGTIQIGAKEENGWMRVWVQDDGPGVSADDRARVFEKFSRAKGKEKISGLGIGLAFCRLAVDGHGGQIWIESSNGKQNGARFSLTLPIAQNK